MSSTHDITSFFFFKVVKPFLIDTFQHWLLYDKLSSNNNINNYHHVNVIKYVSWSWQLVELLSCIMLTSLFSSVWTLMLILFSRLINSSLLCMLIFLKQWSFLLCSVTMFCLYKTVSHCSRWEFISHCTSTQFWFKVRTCWFLMIVLTVRNAVWCFF